VKTSSDAGLFVLDGSDTVPIDSCMAMAGAMLRNYIDARVMPLNTVITTADRLREDPPAVLLIPDACTKELSQKNIASWRIQEVSAILLERYNSNLKTVLYSSYDGLQITSIYGPMVWSLVENHYTQISK